MDAQPVPEGQYAQLANGLRLHYHDVGEGPVLVWLHGSGNGACGYSNFQGNYPQIAAAGYRCIVPDLPGFGYSDKPQDIDYHLDVFVDAVHQLLAALNIPRATLVGNSLGGAVALGHALAYPAEVTRLILMAPGGLNELPDYLAMPDMQAIDMRVEPLPSDRWISPSLQSAVQDRLAKGLISMDSVDDQQVEITPEAKRAVMIFGISIFELLFND